MIEIGDTVTYICQFSQKQTIGRVIDITSIFEKPAYIVKDKQFTIIAPKPALTRVNY